MKSSVLISILFLIGSLTNAVAQNLTQTIRGTVLDQDSKMTLPGANAVIVNSNPFLGASSDMDGNFRIDNVPVGRVDLRITFMGYEDKNIPNLVVSSGKEVVLIIELIESLVDLQAVEITARQNKAEVLNEMAMISARTFSVDETQRYAGSFNDPARMVSAFAGVTSDAQGDNNIVVRGNSSKGILWRLEGTEIPNPNHFADEGQTGGPINALNSSMLANSDFFTGAFAPEYGNASSGVFDMKLRTGNNEQREYSFSAGVLGLDMTMEGPFSEKSDASYLINYRYSSLAILDQLNLVDFQGVPKYQDASFKLNLPTKRAGSFSMFGLGGRSNIHQEDQDVDDPTIIHATSDYKSNMGVTGINHVLPLTNNSYLKNGVSVAQNGSGQDYQEPVTIGNLETTYSDYLAKTALRFSSTLNSKINAKHKLQNGVIYTQYFSNFSSSFRDEDLGKMVDLLDEKNNSGLVQGFTSWKYRINEELTLVSGVHYMHFLLNDANSVEPRMGLKWQFKPGRAFNAGFGVHSKLEPMTAYFAMQTRPDGSQFQPNRNLGLGKANHYVLGYEHMLSEHMLFKMETYYQQLYNVPVENNVSSSFSLVNTSGWFTDRTLVNQGTGKNYGVELTLEHYLHNNFFFLLTGSVYESKYTALDGIERDTRFNGNYASNFLFGKEFSVGDKAKNKTLGLSGKVMFIGGNRYTPVDLEQSKVAGYDVRSLQAFSAKGEQIFQANAVVYYRREKEKTSHEIKLDIQNVTNNDAIVDEYYSARTQEIEYGRQLSIIPSIYYKINF